MPTGDPSDVGNIGGPSSLVDGSSGAPSLGDVGGLRLYISNCDPDDSYSDGSN